MVLDMGELAGAAEIGRMLGGVSRQRVQQIVNRDDFPAPFDVLDMGKVWKREAVEAWARSHGRDITDADS
jgi:predicted DNA-binding transcriptional regulator AlpA